MTLDRESTSCQTATQCTGPRSRQRLSLRAGLTSHSHRPRQSLRLSKVKDSLNLEPSIRVGQPTCGRELQSCSI
eukprot:1388591-Rhodomonas_salina.2